MIQSFVFSMDFVCVIILMILMCPESCSVGLFLCTGSYRL